jgi:multiple sugar transport system permease protein
VVFLLPLFRVFSTYGLLDTQFGLIIVNTGFNMPFAVWLMSRYLATVPKELEEAAYVDGATEFGAMIRVVAPLAAPGIVVSFIFSFMSGWNEFTFALTFMTSQQKMPVTLGLYEFVGHFSVQWNYLMGACLLAVIPPAILFIAIQRYLIGGLTTGSLK